MRTNGRAWAVALAYAVLFATLGAGAAQAHVVALAPVTSVRHGPVVVGEATVWEQSLPDAQETELRYAAPDGTTTTVLRTDGRTTCDMVRELAGSSLAYVVTMLRNTRTPTSCGYGARTEILLGRAGAPALVPLAGDAGGGCQPFAANIDGGHLAVLRGDCPGRELAVLDVRTGATLAELPFSSDRTFRASKVAIGGRYLAVTGVPGTRFDGGTIRLDITPKVWFYDWQQPREVAVVDASRPGRETMNADDDFAMDSDGVTVLSTMNIDSPLAGPSIDWMSPADPQIHAVPVKGYPTQLGIERGAFGIVRGGDYREVILGVDGGVRLDLGPLANGDVLFRGVMFKDQDGYGIDIDDGRIALERNGSIVNDTIPPALPEPAVQRPSAGGGLRVIEGKLTPSVIAAQRVEVAIVQLADGLRPGAVRAAAAATGKPAHRRCKQATARGRLTTFKPRDGRCNPTRFLRAKGTVSWRLELPRRLPRGRYAVYTRVVDVAGRASRVTAKDALTVRVRK